MKLKQSIYLLFALALICVCAGNIFAQNTASKIWMNVHDNNGGNYLMQYGNDVAGTYTIDLALNEAEAPPPPIGLDVVWINIPGRSNTWGRGLLGNDMRPVPTNPTLKDTFKLQFGIGDQPDSNVYFVWPDPAYLALRCDSMFLVYFDPNLPGNVTINMFTQSTLYIEAAGTNSINKITIYKYGTGNPLPDTDVKQISPAVPESFRLNQNYPNPFNPTTTIKFDIQKSSVTEIGVYNVLGQKVATLVSKQLAPGTYSTVWNGTADNGVAVSSGVYFVRLSALAEGSEPFVALRKLLLMK